MTAARDDFATVRQIPAVLAGGLINSLVVDDATASTVLASIEQV